LTGFANAGKIAPLLFGRCFFLSIEELKNKKVVVGKRETEKAIKKGKAKKVFLAQDVDEELQQELIGLLEGARVLWEYVPRAKDLGLACGIDIEASCAAIIED